VTNANTISVFTNSGDALHGSPYSGGGINAPLGILVSSK
jgi:uncharacterized membrane protein